MFYIYTCILLILCDCGICNPQTVRVTVEQGVLEGQVLTPSTGRGTYYSFKGIPYAAPPVGSLRFKAPQPPIWTGVRNATAHGSICVQYDGLSSNNIIGNEDCLFLNVYSPNLHPKKPMVVMFFIHGGFFITGSGDDTFYAPDFLMDFEVVLVTINYRLDVFGFLSADTRDVPGNAGLKDQIAALKWVKANIKAFGGDPDSITIFGSSVGGSSVTFHLVSPAAKGLFKRIISMSGTLLNYFATCFEHRRRAFALGNRLGTNTTDPNELITFLQSVPAERLIQVRPNIILSDDVTHRLLSSQYFAPIVEKKFGGNQYLTEQPCTLNCQGKINDADIMIGHALAEGLKNTVDVEDLILEYYPKFLELFVPVTISNIRSPKTVLKLGDEIRNFYFGNGTVSPSTISSFVEYLSSSRFTFDIHRFTDNIIPKKLLNRLYFYIFAIYSSRNYYAQQASRFGIRKATHRDDNPYLFDGSAYNYTVDVNSEAFGYVVKMCTLFTNFAKYGNPTPDDSFGLIWPVYGPERNVVQIAANLTTDTVRYDNNLGFFRSLYRKARVRPYIGQ